jgi:hypothetical protein
MSEQWPFQQGFPFHGPGWQGTQAAGEGPEVSSSPKQPSARRLWVLLLPALIVLLSGAGVAAWVLTASSGGHSPSAGSNGPSQGGATGQAPDTTEGPTPQEVERQALAALAHQYAAYTAAFDQTVSSLGPSAKQITTDIGNQQARIQQDQITYANSFLGQGCSFLSPDYASCYQSALATAENAQRDEVQANQQISNDYSQLGAVVGQWEQALNVYIAQLEGMSWTPSVSGLASQLITDLTSERRDLGQLSVDLQPQNQVAVTNDLHTVEQDGSQVDTDQINLQTALGIPAPGASSIVQS